MTDADKPAFVQAFGRLAVALRSGEPDAVQLKVYYDTLRDLEIEFVVEAATRLLRGEFFPTTGAWRAMAGRVERERVEEQRKLLQKLPQPLCMECLDTGWADAGPGMIDTVRGPRHAASRARPCGCQQLRRLEVLGRRPWPSLPAAVVEPPPTPDAAERVEAMATDLARRKGMPPLSAVECARLRDDA